jgi:cytoplasmic tRNA 2-thiolation protein 2
METYKFKGPKVAVKNLLLPLSYGASSTTLLYLLDNQIQAQFERMGRNSYVLIVAHVNLGFEDAAANQQAEELLSKVKARFPKHTYINASLEDALDIQGLDWSSIGVDNIPGKIECTSGQARLQAIFNAVSAATSKVDIASTLMTRLLVDLAEKNDCEGILFGDSTTRLAEKTLVQTAKGRGFSLPWQVSDGASPYGVSFQYPLRDLLKKEIVLFTTLASPPLSDLIIARSPLSHLSVSSKSTTIDDLMTQYFESVEENYPSIVANVVRTSSKLKASELVSNSVPCSLCGIPVTNGTDGIYGWGGDQSFDARPLPTGDTAHHGILCYGCSRSING